MYDYTKYEQETIINFNEEEKEATVFTFNKKLQKLLDERSKTDSRCKVTRKTEDIRAYIVPKSWISVRFPKELSEATKAKYKENGKKMAE